ncbi:hypothetical protein [Streptomyces liliifuscus]|uniref:Uncharacterized protein n=1 Tax=Streptomyces liliifuscus TaxID=2797636 RepID=A0A7T7I6K8_9ACTN|nr:hypothetical protein [Streptomyces liliifuscus]QQM41963.1 hypothetical protein JEQ17_22645 [Streptomyces liliifuscus]
MSGEQESPPPRHTRTRPIRVPGPLWDAYGRICERLDTDRTNDLLDHMRARVREHGDEQDRADLAKAEQELAERRARKGGRPKGVGGS